MTRSNKVGGNVAYGNVQDTFVSAHISILEAIQALDSSALQVLLVVDKDNGLPGTVTDGDIRRAILRGINLSSKIETVMNNDPVTIDEEVDKNTAQALMRDKSIHCLPILDKSRRVVGLETETRLFWEGTDDTLIVLMAGGLGMRLRPLTENVPKPMLEISGRPILEHIIRRFAEQGFYRFLISVNYLGDLIKDYFGDGSNIGVNIDYIDETLPLGTGGALSLVPEDKISDDLIVMNGDLLCTLNFRQLLHFHRKNSGGATMAVREYSFRVPYGVVEVDGESFIKIVEKPAQTFLVNAGIYAIQKDRLKLIPNNKFFNLPDLFELLYERGERVLAFPLKEEWHDIGSHADYTEALKSSL